MDKTCLSCEYGMFLKMDDDDQVCATQCVFSSKYNGTCPANLRCTTGDSRAAPVFGLGRVCRKLIHGENRLI
ncbi:hypothetical protein [Methanolacinia paynteri]|uniref:hypothetical protein n=1 Tax=Methanolacinia paynteri TaxID=230356 RepID=UPI001B80D8E0|nr:hypothetical protein [Methanolacinia paynteri]